MSTPAATARLDWVELRRLARFCAVGALNTGLTLAAFALLLRVGMPAAVASAAGFGLGALNGYQLNARWTFAGARRDRGAVARYVLVQLGGAVLSAGGDTYRLGCAQMEVQLVDISDLYVSPERETGQEYVVRTYLCPHPGHR